MSMRLLWIVTMILLAVGCASQDGFTVDRSFSGSLAAHHGYQVQPLESATAGLLQVAEQQITEEMSEKGYAHAMKPEMLVRYYLVPTDKAVARRHEVILTAYQAWEDNGLRRQGVTPSLQAIPPGGLAIMIVDAKTGLLLWERIATPARRPASPDEAKKRVRAMITALMADLPERNRW